MKFPKKFTIKVPKDIKIIYHVKQNFVILIGPLSQKLLKLKFKLLLKNKNNSVYMTILKSKKFINNKKKILRALRGTFFAYIKQIILEISIILCQKIKLIGLGFKMFSIDFYKCQLLQLKIGFSHSIYYKINDNSKIVFSKSVLFYIFGSSYYLVNQIAAKIRSYKVPEVYKGKGILYENEKIDLKKGKKI